ncbi:DUF4390 domain-containing protein [Suttonella sp. R2A3]|uniref:DUF4390 domain-containing protein n=1 Tax=Suttonella sp. R2A3 TaxID=2908648 RepID=UPI001F2CF820|nr:DUF4390 domain-containing protein [Suttonella sp. R2A3]UJF24172.1 DUF4390 domain-containing protein [Suttonella sp. R2A3]
MRALLFVLSLVSLWTNASITTTQGACYLKDGQIYLDLNNNIELGEEPRAALQSGIVLYFAFEVTIDEHDGWFAKSHDLRRELMLRYEHIARQFTIEDPVTLRQHSYSSLDTALVALGHIQALPLIDRSLLPDDANPQISANLTLVYDNLPVALRLNALVNKD